MTFRSELSELSSLGIVCDDCGRRKRWARPAIADMEATRRVYSLHQLGSRLCCSYCRERGSDGRNISLWPTSAMDGSSQDRRSA